MAARLTMSDLAPLFERGVFDRGLDYADQGAVFSLRQEGNILRGQVMGSQLYQTRFQLIPPYECWCTCPYDGGSCKHAAALAITWLRREAEGDEPGSTARNDSIGERLGRLGENDLFRLIMELIDTVPGVRAATEELLLERDVEAMGSAPGLAREEAEAVRSLLRSLLTGDRTDLEEDEEGDGDWEEDGEEEEDWEEDPDEDWERHLGIENERDEELLALDGQIDALISAVESHSLLESLPFRVLALAGCSVELVRVAERRGGFADRWSRQIERMVTKTAGLVAEPSCPHEIAEDALSEWLDCFHESFSRLVDQLKPGLVAASSAPDRREWLLGLVAERLRTANEPGLKRLHDLAGEVHASAGDVRAALESLRKAGASADTLLELARKCQKLGDSEAAMEACRMAVGAATPWNAAGVRSRAAKVLLAVGDRAGARALLLENFRESPSLEAARSALDAAERPEQRQEMAAVLVAQVDRSGNQALRVRLHLEARRPRSALGVLTEIREYQPELHVEVAAGIAETDIDTAVDLWSKAVKYLIGRKNRSAYAEAAEALVHMRRALGQAGQQVRWQKYYWDLQERYRSYRALKDELEQAGL